VALPIVWRGLKPPRVLIIIDPENVHKGTEKKIFEVEERTLEKPKHTACMIKWSSKWYVLLKRHIPSFTCNLGTICLIKVNDTFEG